MVAAASVQADQRVLWDELKLAGASGVPDEPDHRYIFKGLLTVMQSTSKSGFSLSKGPYSTSTTKTAARFWVEGVGKWDASRNEADEALVFDGEVKANLRFVLKCSSDPWLTKQACTVKESVANTEKGKIFDWPGMVRQSRLPLTAQIVTREAAVALSKQSAANAPPPPPPPPAAEPSKPLQVQRPGSLAASPHVGTSGSRLAQYEARQPLKADARALQKPVIPQPKLSITGLRAEPQSGCVSPKAAAVLHVEIRNTGAPLPAGKGTVYAKEIGGKSNLTSAGLHLPGIGAGAKQIVDIPVSTRAPYASLAGAHLVGIYLNPMTVGGTPSFSKPAAPYKATISFPSGFCQQRPSAPAAVQKGILTPDETRGLRPQPEPPGRQAVPQAR